MRGPARGTRHPEPRRRRRISITRLEVLRFAQGDGYCVVVVVAVVSVVSVLSVVVVSVLVGAGVAVSVGGVWSSSFLSGCFFSVSTSSSYRYPHRRMRARIICSRARSRLFGEPGFITRGLGRQPAR